MRTRLLTCIALAIGVVVAPAAGATGSNTFRGGCTYHVEPTTGTSQVGVIGDVSVTSDATGVPIGATVTCWIAVNGVEAPGTRHTYGDIGAVPGVQGGADPITYQAGLFDLVNACEMVVYADQTTTGAQCIEDTGIEMPPRVVWDAAEHVLTTARDAACDRSICGVLCPSLASVAGTYGRVTIEPDGDVYVLTPLSPPVREFFDCPPST